MVDLIPTASLVLIVASWLMAWRVGHRWVSGLGVSDRFARVVMSLIVPTATLIASVHLLALASLLLGRGWTTLPAVAVVSMVVTCGLTLCHRRIPPATPDVEPPTCADETLPRYWYIPPAILVGVYAVFAVDAATRYPTGYDAMYYHLPVALRWMREGALNVELGFNYLSHPENGMIVPFLLASAGFERLICLAHLPKAVLMALSVAGLARSLGVGKAGTIAAACIALSVPMVIFQSFSGYVDLYAASHYLAALLAVCAASRLPGRSRRHVLVIAGLSAGIALGSKITFLVMVPMLVLVVAGMGWLDGRTVGTCRSRPAASVAIFAAATLVCSGFWLIRGTVQAGNPVYPLGVAIAGKQILPGTMADEVFPRRPIGVKLGRWWDYPWRETKYSGTGYPYSVNNAVGAAYTAFVPVGVVAAGLILWRRRRRPGHADPGDDDQASERARRWLAVYLLITLSGAVLLMTVFREMLRFVLPQLLLAAVVAALLIDQLSRRYPRTVCAVLSLALLTTGLVAAYRPAHDLAVRVRDGQWDRAGFYGIPALVDELPAGAQILNLADPMMNYALAGRSLTNVVIDPNVWKRKLCPDGVSAAALREHGVDYIYTRAPFSAGWPVSLPVSVVYDDSDIPPLHDVPATRIYQVAPTASLAATGTDARP